jgi:hypothetical protein
MTSAMEITGSDSRPRTRVGSLLVVLVAAFAMAGVIVAGWQIREGTAGASRPPAAVGETVETDYGSVTITRTRTTVVPDSQGPPTAAQHAGTNGADQLQVWVRFVNTKAPNGVRYDPRRFRLLHAANPGHSESIAGSTLAPDRLRAGSSIEGQIWFELAGLPAGRYLLECAAPGVETVRFDLGRLEPHAVSEDHSLHDHGSGAGHGGSRHAH